MSARREDAALIGIEKLRVVSSTLKTLIARDAGEGLDGECAGVRCRP